MSEEQAKTELESLQRKYGTASLSRRGRVGTVAGSRTGAAGFQDGAGADASGVLQQHFSLTAAMHGAVPVEDCGTVKHVFSHVHHLYSVQVCRIPDGEAAPRCATASQACRWLSRAEMEEAALSTCMRKVFTAAMAPKGPKGPKGGKAGKRKRGDETPTISTFFAPAGPTV